jgi:hypothetical protein
MSLWDFLSSRNDSTVIFALTVMLVAPPATLSITTLLLDRLTTFLVTFARLSKKQRADTLALAKRLPKALGR